MILHWHDEFFYRGGFLRQLPTDLALWLLYRLCRNIEVICHETYPLPSVSGWRQVVRVVHAWARRRVWRAASKVTFHSEVEWHKMEKTIGVRLNPPKVRIQPHGTYFVKFREVDRETARQELGIPQDVTMFLCLGFLGESKGFHRAVEAFRSLDSTRARLYIVGSALYDAPEVHAYIARLRQMVEQTPGVALVERFVSDEEFDTWLSACDVLIAPYERAFSSSVVARAKLFNRLVIASAVGGLPKEVNERDRLFRDDAELAKAMRDLLSRMPIN